jgi:acyl-CoA dehydrogenase family protein 9
MKSPRFDSFLENLYFGEFDREAFRYREADAADPDVKRLVNGFLEASKEYPPDRLEKLGRVPDDLLDKLKKTGFFGLIIPKEYGGQGLDLHRYLAVVEEIVKTDMALGILSLAHLSIGVMGVILYGSCEQKERYLSKAAAGDMIFCYALTEPLTGSDARHIQTAAVLSPDRKTYVLNGTKTFITNANYSGGLTVFAQLDPEKPGSLGAFIVETAWEGVSIGKDMEKMGLKASSTASIQLKNVRVPVENMIGGPGDGFRIAMTILNYGRLALGAASSGMLSASLSDMRKRSAMRQQFQVPIARFELLQEMMVNAWVRMETVRAMTHLTAGILDRNPLADAATESSHVKLYGTNRAWDSLYDSMQLAGGSGYLSNQPYDKRMRDFRVATIFEGTTEIHGIYPPLSLARKVQKSLRGKSLPGRLFVLAGLKIPGAGYRPGNPALRRAASEIRSEAAIYRKLFLTSVTRLGKRLPEREFLLRRMTTVSVHLYALVSLCAKVEAWKAEGRDVDDLLTVLSGFIETAKRETRRNAHFRPDAAEKMHPVLFARIDPAPEK